LAQHKQQKITETELREERGENDLRSPSRPGEQALGSPMMDREERQGINRFQKIEAFKLRVYDLCLYSTFCLLFTILMTANYNSHSYMLGEAMSTLLLSSRTVVTGTANYDFENIRDLDSFWGWLKGPFLVGAYTDPDVTGEHRGGDGWQGPGWMYGNNHIIGAIHLRQLRVTRSSDVSSKFGANVQWKYPEWEAGTQQTTAYGPGSVYVYKETSDGILDHFSGRYEPALNHPYLTLPLKSEAICV